MNPSTPSTPTTPTHPYGSPFTPGFHPPVGSSQNTTLHSPPGTGPRTPINRAAQGVAQHLMDDASPTVLSPSVPFDLSTMGTASVEREPGNEAGTDTSRENDIHTFPARLIAYRGDNSFNPLTARNYKKQFFTFQPDVAKLYGSLVVQLESAKEIKLLRLDKNVGGFRHWLNGSKSIPAEDKKILSENFGYPLSETDTQTRGRVSDVIKDATMLSMIETYAKKTHQDFHGYFNDIMLNRDSENLKSETGQPGRFHAEIAVFDNEVFGQPKLLGRHTKQEIQALNQDAMATRLQNKDREARQGKKRSRLDEAQSLDPNTSPALNRLNLTELP